MKFPKKIFYLFECMSFYVLCLSENLTEGVDQGWPTLAHCMFRGGAFQV